MTDMLAQEEKWKLSKNKKGIKVYTLKVNSSKLNDSRATTLVNSTIDKVLEKLNDVLNHYRWMDKIGRSNILERVSDHEFYAYYVAKSPWPVLDRDIIAHYKIEEQSPGTVLLSIVGAPNFIPKKRNKVRIKDLVSSWLISDEGEGQVSIVYQHHADPGGNVPEWLVNTAAEENPYNTLLGLIKQLKKK